MASVLGLGPESCGDLGTCETAVLVRRDKARFPAEHPIGQAGEPLVPGDALTLLAMHGDGGPGHGQRSLPRRVGRLPAEPRAAPPHAASRGQSVLGKVCTTRCGVPFEVN